MSRLLLAVVALTVAALSACAPAVREASAPASRRAKVTKVVRCDEAAGEATMGSISTARYFARFNLDQNLGGTRGYLAAQGARQVRVVARDMQCQPYPLGGGLTRCVAVARLCGT